MSETAGRYALLIGANRYDDARLKSLQSPAADLGALGEVLADPALGDFVVDSLLDETCQAVRIGIERFLSGRARDDVVLIYCSVHGLMDERGRLYLALRDTERDVLRATGMSSSFLLEALASCRSSAKVLILDCDYSGAVLRGAPTPEGTIILTATSALAYAFEDADRQHGLFTAHLVQGLRSGDADLDGDGAITFEELFAYVRACVIEAQTDQSPRSTAPL